MREDKLRLLNGGPLEQSMAVLQRFIPSSEQDSAGIAILRAAHSEANLKKLSHQKSNTVQFVAYCFVLYLGVLGRE